MELEISLCTHCTKNYHCKCHEMVKYRIPTKQILHYRQEWKGQWRITFQNRYVGVMLFSHATVLGLAAYLAW